MAKTKRMDQIKTILEVYKLCGSLKETSRRLSISKTTVKQYVRRILTHCGSIEVALSLPEEGLQELYYNKRTYADESRSATFDSQLTSWKKELSRKGVTRHLLWEEYKKEHPSGYSYSQFCDRLRHHIQSRDLSMYQEHNPGQELMLDFAGSKLHWIEESSGEQRWCEVLIGVLPYSNYTCVLALPSQGMEDFVHGINVILRQLGGLPEAILSDNLKSFVIKSDRYEPTFNELCVQLSTFYSLDLHAARPRHPKDKASVENMVQQVYRQIYAPLRNEVFHSLESLNAAITSQVDKLNDKTFQIRPGSRKSCFEALEQPALRPLPRQMFSPSITLEARVNKNYHVLLSRDKCYYSVPYQYVGKQATLVCTYTNVEIYVQNKRVATHPRLNARSPGSYSTQKEHMPEAHQQYKLTSEQTREDLLALAQKIGLSSYWAMQQVLRSHFYDKQCIRSGQGLISLSKKYGADRLEKAALRCRVLAGQASYRQLKSILEKNLDKCVDDTPQLPELRHENIRGAQEYQ